MHNLVLIFILFLTGYSQILQNASLDLSVTDLNNGPVKLEGKWRFYWQKLVESEEEAIDVYDFIEVPSNWGDNPNYMVHSFASYRLDILAADTSKTYGLYIYEINSSYNLYLNGVLIDQMGQVAKTENNYNAKVNSRIVALNLKKRNNIVIEVSNYRHMRSGIWRNISFGHFQDIQNKYRNEVAIDLFYFGSFLIIGLYMIILYFIQKNDKHLLYLGLTCVVVAFRMLLMNTNYFRSFFPDLDYYIYYRLNISTYYLAVITLLSYYRHFFEKYMKMTIYKALIIISVAFTASLFIVHDHWNHFLLSFYHPVSLFGSVYACYIIYKAYRDEYPWAREAFFSVLILFLALVNNIVSYYIPSYLNFNIAEALLMFVVFNAFIIAKKYSNAFDMHRRYLENQKKISQENENMANEITIINEVLQDMNKELEAKVEERSKVIIEKNKLLEEAKDKAEKANRSKTIFFSFMTHELRTPINAVIGYSELLKEDMGDDKETRYVSDVEKIHEAGMHLLEVVNNLLDFAKIDAGKMQLSIEHFKVNSFLEEVKNAIYPLSLKNKNQFQIDNLMKSKEIYNDRLKIKIVVINLLSNACKFTSDGEIKLVLSESEKRIRFEVFDTGIGMTPRQQKNLFQEFSQGDENISKNYGGSGLGLLITKKYCELLFGDIQVESEYGKGSHFTVRIKKQEQEQQEIHVL